MEKTAVTLSQAEKRLEELVSRVQAGEGIFISRRGRVVAVMTDLEKTACRQALRLGLMEGGFAVPENAGGPLPPAVAEETGLAEGQRGAEI